MLWKEFKKQEDCSGCPLLKEEICPGGWTCYGSEPIEPPCCSFEDDTDLNQWVEGYYENLNRIEELKDRKIKEDQKRKERAEKAAKTRRQMESYCYAEITELKQAKKALEAHLALVDYAQSYAEAVNFANKAFRYEERLTVNPQISEKTELLQARVDKANSALKAKKKQFYEERNASNERT